MNRKSFLAIVSGLVPGILLGQSQKIDHRRAPFGAPEWMAIGEMVRYANAKGKTIRADIGAVTLTVYPGDKFEDAFERFKAGDYDHH
jgi:hypothetical protein